MAEEEAARRAALTPNELAQMVEGSDLVRRLPGVETTKLAPEIARLSDSDRYLLALAAEGRDNRELAHHLYLPQQTVARDLRRILKSLRAKTAQTARPFVQHSRIDGGIGHSLRSG